MHLVNNNTIHPTFPLVSPIKIGSIQATGSVKIDVHVDVGDTTAPEGGAVYPKFCLYHLKLDCPLPTS